MRVTRNQVAELAKVSSATVSRVFNSPSSVSKSLRDAVYEAANKLGYKPNKNAALLRRSSTGVICVVEIDKSNRPYYWGALNMFDWFYGQAMRGLHSAIENTSYQLNFCKISSREELDRVVLNCDGVIGYDIDDEFEESLFLDLSVPYLLAHHILPSNKYNHVSTNNMQGGIIQGKYLKSLNCKKPLYITGYLDKVIAHSQRLEGLKSVYPDLSVMEVPFIEQNKINELILSIKESFENNEYDSLASVNDYTLTKVLLKIGGTFPAIGYDSAPFTKFLNRSVASIDLNIEGIYKSALTNLIKHINGSPVESLTVSPKLVL